MATRLVQIAMNARDDAAVGRFWAETLGWSVASEEPGVTNVEPVGFAYPDPVAVCIDVLAVPEPKTVKNRVHIDLATTSATHQADLVARLQDLGATPADVGQGDVPWTALAGRPGHRASGCGDGRLRGSAGHGPVLGRGDGLDPAPGDRRSRGAALRHGCRTVSPVPPHAG